MRVYNANTGWTVIEEQFEGRDILLPIHTEPHGGKRGSEVSTDDIHKSMLWYRDKINNPTTPKGKPLPKYIYNTLVKNHAILKVEYNRRMKLT